MNPPTFQEFDVPRRKPNTREQAAEVGIRKSTADAVTSEARAPYAARNAAADASLSEANARRAAAQAAALEAKMAAEAEANAAKGATAGRDRSEKLETLTGYLGTLQRARDVVSSGAATGIVGQVTGGVWGTPAADLKGILESIANPVVLEAMAEARKGSAAGATGFGALSQKELELLKGKFGSLRQSQDPETLLRTIDEIEQAYRRLTAYNAGYDPYTAEGAVLVGLPVPEGADEPAPEDPAAPMEIVPKGETVKNPELAGVNAAIRSMVEAGRSPEQIRQYLNEVSPGAGDKVLGVEEAVANFRKTGKAPRVNVEDTYVPGDETMISKIGDSPLGAVGMAMADQFTSGFMGEAAAGEMSGEDYNRTSAVMRGLREKYPGWSMFGDLTGGTLSAVGGAAAGAKMGLKLPGLLEGIGQEAFYGMGSSEPGQRLEGGLYGAALAPVTNLAGKTFSDAVGGVLRGSKPERAVLAEKYGINLTPGQLTGREATERNVAGLPILGPQVTARRNETLEQFNQAAFDDALKPIGGRVGGVGQQGIAEAQAATAQAYRDALDGVTLDITDPAFMPAVRGKSYAALAGLKDIGPELTSQVDDIFAKYVDPQNGVLTGENLQNALQELQGLKQAYKQDPRWAKRIGPALDDISDGYAGLLERQAPDNFGMFNRANEAYRNVSILERAVEGAPDGALFGPGNLRTATKLGTQRFGGKKASARGDRPFNELVMTSLGVIPSKIDDASMLGRVIAPAAGAGGFGAITATSMLAQPENDRIVDEGDGTFPPWVLAAAAGAGLASLPFSRRGVRAMAKPLLGPRTDRQRMLGEMLQNYGPAALRGVVRPTEPDAPMPQEFDYGKVGSPELRRIIQSAAAGSQPLTPEERTSLDLGGFVPTYEDVPAEGASPMAIDGRRIERDPETGEMVYSDTGEPVPGYRKGGKVKRPLAVKKAKKPLAVNPRRKARG